jgi:hypothetical protein
MQKKIQKLSVDLPFGADAKSIYGDAEQNPKLSAKLPMLKHRL